jgi:hypothetical protein
MSDVYLSYSSKDKHHAETLAKELQALGISAWLDSKDLVPGSDFEKAVGSAISDARLIAFLVEPGASREKVQWEYMEALGHSWSDNEKILLPILIGKAEPPSFLRHSLALRVRSRNPEWARTAKQIAKLLSQGGSVKRRKPSVKEQMKRLNLIERGANALRVNDDQSVRKQYLNQSENIKGPTKVV